MKENSLLALLLPFSRTLQLWTSITFSVKLLLFNILPSTLCLGTFSVKIIKTLLNMYIPQNVGHCPAQ